MKTKSKRRRKVKLRHEISKLRRAEIKLITHQFNLDKTQRMDSPTNPSVKIRLERIGKRMRELGVEPNSIADQIVKNFVVKTVMDL
jgi:hypothetical protein